MKRIVTVSLLSLLFLAYVPQDASAQTRIRFARGRTSASVSSTIYGNAQRKYILAARAGQYLSATVSSRNAASCSVIRRPVAATRLMRAIIG